ADEVRKLADRTTKATDEIAQSIRAIQTDTTAAAERMNGGTEAVTQGVSLAREARQALHTIVEGAGAVATAVASIASASEEQSAGATQIARNIENIRLSTGQNAEGASQAATAATNLSTKAEHLQQLMSRFK